MPETFPPLLLLAGALVATGAIAGVIAGFLGVGGGIVIVPILYFLFTAIGVDEGVRMHLAVGTSLATFLPTASVSALGHHRRGAVDRALLKRWGFAIFAGVVLGASIGGFVKGTILTGAFATLALVVATYLFFGRKDFRLADRLPTGLPLQAAGALIGGLSAMIGIGGGTMTVPYLNAFAYPMPRAVGTAAAIGLLIGVPGATVFAIAGLDAAGLPPYSLGYVSLPAFALISAGTIVAAPYGVRLAHALSASLLRRAFALFLVATAARMYWGLFG